MLGNQTQFPVQAAGSQVRQCGDHAQSIRAPVASSTAHKMRLNQGTGTRVLKCEPNKPPGIEPIKSEATKVGSTLPARQCSRLVTPVSATACTISVPTITLGGEL